MVSKKKLVLRSLMFVPGHNEKLYDSALKCDADALLFDLEDSVQPTKNKLIARQMIVSKLKDDRFDNYLKFVRLNEISTEFFLTDVIEVSKANIDSFLLSKANNKEDVLYLDMLLTSIELERGYEKGKFSIIPILESTSSIVNIKEIAECSTRIIALGFGSEDFVSELKGVRDFNTNYSISLPRSYVPIVARSYGLEAIDAAYIKVHDDNGLVIHAQQGKVLGYSGMWVLHPKQINIVNEIYSPTEEEYIDALKIMELKEKADKQDKGVAIIEGRFIGPPLVIKAKEIIERKELIVKRKKLWKK